MNEVIADFRERVREITRCLSYVAEISKTDVAVAKTLKGACYVLVYNMIEATATRAVQAAFDHFESKNIVFGDVRTEVREFVLRHAKKQNPHKLADMLCDDGSDLITRAFSSAELFSGNVDSRRLKSLAKSLGFSPNFRGDPADVLRIKDNRNDLSHGDKTFSEVGREVTLPELRQHTASAIWTMRALLRNVNDYLLSGDYRRGPYSISV